MINKSSLLQMKDNIMLINTSRGALINTTDIIEALKVVKLVIRD
jgi:D-lactate dehydrogenase